MTSFVCYNICIIIDQGLDFYLSSTFLLIFPESAIVSLLAPRSHRRRTTFSLCVSMFSPTQPLPSDHGPLMLYTCSRGLCFTLKQLPSGSSAVVTAATVFPAAAQTHVSLPHLFMGLVLTE